MNDRQIDLLISAYGKLQAVNDFEFFLSAAGDIIEVLAFVPQGERNDVDLLLGRRNATLPQRADYGQAANETTGQYIDRIWDSIPEEAY